MALAVYKETWKWYAQVGEQNLKKKKKIPREESSRREEMIINVRRGPTEYKS